MGYIVQFALLQWTFNPWTVLSVCGRRAADDLYCGRGHRRVGAGDDLDDPIAVQSISPYFTIKTEENDARHDLNFSFNPSSTF